MSEIQDRVAQLAATLMWGERAKLDQLAEHSRRLAYEKAEAILEAIVDGIGWPEINAYRDELAKGQDIYEDAGGFFVRALRALLGRPTIDPVTNHQEAVRRMLGMGDGASP